MTALTKSLLETLRGQRIEVSRDEHPRIEADLSERLNRAKATWHGLVIPRNDVAAYLGERLQLADEPADADAILIAIERLSVTDLYLCCGCTASDSRALSEFEVAFGAEIESAVRRLDSSGDLGDEVRQVLRNKLFVAESGACLGIERYLGRGPLGRWLWVMATREALMWHRSRRREIALTDGHQGIADGDLELDYLKREYRSEFRLAFSEAITTLDSKQRNLLFYHFARRLTIDQIAGIYRVHRVTVFRWLRTARTSLVVATRKSLATRLRVGVSELDSIMRLVKSNFEVSVERILSDGQAPPPI